MGNNEREVLVPTGIKNVDSFLKLKKFLQTGNYKYIRTVIISNAPPDRNAPCPCGSGKKCKKCCGV